MFDYVPNSATSGVRPKRFIFAAVLILGAIWIAHSQTNNWSKRIVSKTETPLSVLLNPHVGDVNVVIIDKKRFEHVRGVKQFYLPVPGTNAVVFIVDEKDYSVTYHLFMLDTDEDLAIHAPSSMFGDTIGFTSCRDSIEKVSNGSIVLCNLDPDAKSTLPELSNLHSVKSLYTLDLNKKTVTGKTLYLDKDGNIIDERSDYSYPAK